MTTQQLVIPKGKGAKRLAHDVIFADQLKKISNDIGFRLSARGWGYQLEGLRLINKDEFNLVEKAINRLRKKGLLPIDFVAEEQGRRFKGVEWATDDSVPEFVKRYLEAVNDCDDYFTTNWWQGERYYIQIIVEKIDLVSLFYPVCMKYHIPIATSSGWASMLMRANYANRFKLYEENDYECVLLYCGDHDPAGLQISDFLRKNLEDLKNIRWATGDSGYDPENLIIERFGLDADFIKANNLTWIDNLITGSGKDLANPNHADYDKPYVKDYLRVHGARKCEANALVIAPKQAERLITDAIEKYLGKDAISRFEKKEETMRKEFDDFKNETGISELIRAALSVCEQHIDEDD